MGKNQDKGSGINIQDPQHCWGGAKSYDYEDAWSSINHSILSGIHTTLTVPYMIIATEPENC